MPAIEGEAAEVPPMTEAEFKRDGAVGVHGPLAGAVVTDHESVVRGRGGKRDVGKVARAILGDAGTGLPRGLGVAALTIVEAGDEIGHVAIRMYGAVAGSAAAGVGSFGVGIKEAVRGADGKIGVAGFVPDGLGNVALDGGEVGVDGEIPVGVGVEVGELGAADGGVEGGGCEEVHAEGVTGCDVFVGDVAGARSAVSG